MNLSSTAQAKCLIQYSDINNKNRVILKQSREVVQECNDLRISIDEPDEQVGELVERTLRND